MHAAQQPPKNLVIKPSLFCHQTVMLHRQNTPTPQNTQDDSVMALDYVSFEAEPKKLFRQSWQAIAANGQPIYTP